MIIFFEKDSGKIVGTIAGRVHHEQHLRMWIGDQNDTDRIIIQWENSEPQHVQKDLFRGLEEGVESIYDYRVDSKTHQLVKK